MTDAKIEKWIDINILSLFADRLLGLADSEVDLLHQPILRLRSDFI